MRHHHQLYPIKMGFINSGKNIRFHYVDATLPTESIFISAGAVCTQFAALKKFDTLTL